MSQARRLFLFAPLFLSFTSLLIAEEECRSSKRSMQIDLRHSEGSGLGYRQGYTTLLGFFMPSRPFSGFYPFFDVRWHIFNDGRYAATAGIGGRFLRACRSFGIGGYYDYREAKTKNFDQAGFSLESLGRRWDFFANGYFIVGGSKSPLTTMTTQTFFNQIIDQFFNVSQTVFNKRIDLAYSGCDAEAGYHFLHQERDDLYLGAGPYFYWSKFHQRTAGGRVKLAYNFLNYFWLEGRASYDHLFKIRVQGQIGLIIPFGIAKSKKFKLTPSEKSGCKSCTDDLILRARLTELPSHNEILVFKKHTLR